MIACFYPLSRLALPQALAIFAAGIVSVAAVAEELPQQVRFNEHIRPILSDRCFACHGPDEKTRDSDLRLDTSEGATADLGGYAAFVPGQPDASEAFSRVASHDDDLRMPPPSAKKPRLTERELALLRKWIEQGAQYEGHWAFLPLDQSPPPEVASADRVRNPIDQFVLARLENAGIEPAPEADRATRIRRLYVDLLGLLPTPEEVESFVRDPDPNAYESLVDRLLKSPHYGERWGRHWLDQARYADSNGYAIDGEREMWPYRDWVIQALNDNMPFDQFTIEQLAGDLLPNPTKAQLAATGFHRNTLINQEGGTDREQFRVESVMDRVATTGAVWLGLTVGCAQCHTHKFDPITHRDYYQLFAFFNSTIDANDRGPTVEIQRGELFGSPINVPAEPPQLTAVQIANLRQAWESETLARLQPAATATPAAWLPVEYVAWQTKAGTETFELLPDNSLLASGKISAHDEYRLRFATKANRVAAVRLRVLADPSLPKNGPGRAGNGNFVLTGLQLLHADAPLAIGRASADHEQPGFPIAGVLDGDPKTGWAINVSPNSTAKMNADHEAIFVLDEPIVPADRPLELRLLHEVHPDYLIGRLAIEVCETVPPLTFSDDLRLLEALRTPTDTRSAGQKTLLQTAFEHDRPETRPPAKKPNRDVAQLMVMRELPKPRETFLLTRGDFTRPDKKIGSLQPAVLASVPPALSASDRESSAADAQRRLTRLDLARWLVHPENSLTPRVTMNRVWMRYFGRGLVTTEEDFGTQGTPPTHPALLDWLAAELQRQGWSMKAMHRLIVTSATYRQSSRVRSELYKRDPRNLLLARQERIRFDAEVVRDAALTASGLLDRTLGGPGVHPPQPDGMYAFTQVSKRWETATGPERYRRAMYTVYYRSAPYPLFTTFDAPDFQSVCTRRGRSNTPLQSLTLANDIAMFEIAQGLAVRLAREVPGDARQEAAPRVRRALLLCLGRIPSETEQSLLVEYYLRQLGAFSEDVAAAGQLAPPVRFKSLAPAEAAALVCLARAVLNTDNFITRE